MCRGGWGKSLRGEATPRESQPAEDRPGATLGVTIARNHGTHETLPSFGGTNLQSRPELQSGA